MRIVLDTNVVLSALLWRGMPYRLLDAIRSRGEARLFTSPALLDELADVLTRPSATKRLAVIGKAAREALPPWRWSRSTDRRRAATNNTSANRGGIEYPPPGPTAVAHGLVAEQSASFVAGPPVVQRLFEFCGAAAMDAMVKEVLM